MESLGVMTCDYVSRATLRDPIILACQEGDHEAFRLLFEKHKDRVYSIALHFIGNETTAHDITQQVFIKLLSNIQKYNFQSEFTTWLYRLVANTCFDELRRWRRWMSFSEAGEVWQIRAKENLEYDFSKKELSETVRTAICQLKPKLRMPILLKYLEGLSYDEIATVLECSPGTVASRLNRGHKALAGKLEHLQHVL